MSTPWRRSPVFWGVIAAAAVGTGAVFYRKRSQLLGRGAPGPEPKLIARNTARMPTPTEVRKVGDRTLSRYDTPTMSIDERLTLIQKRIWDGVHDPRVRKLAFELTAQCGRDDGLCEAKQVFTAVKSRVRYSGDIGAVLNPVTKVVDPIDYFQSALVTWEYKGGDCDDATILISSLLASIGHTVRLRVTSPTRFGNDEHIYPVVQLDGSSKGAGKWKAVDVTLPFGKATVGTEVGYGRARDYLIEVPA